MSTTASLACLTAFVLSALVPNPAASRDSSRATPLPDALGAEIARWQAYLASVPADGEIWRDVRRGSEPLLLRAEAALGDGRRLLALQRLAAAREGLSAARYLSSLGEREREDKARFEAEWRRVGELLRADLAPPAADTLAGVRPAAARAIGEAALPQVRIYYEASLDYGANTVLDAGLYYIGSALAQRELTSFVRGLAPGDAPPAPELRSLAPELEALEREILAAYRPPASIDRHVDFIRASAALKEARELDALGLRYGALLRYLQAAQSFAAAAGAPSSSGDGTPLPLAARLHDYDERLSSADVDHTLGRLFLETAEALAGRGPDADLHAAEAIATSVLPRYFAALEPAPAVPGRTPARVTVTLVRWPYT